MLIGLLTILKITSIYCTHKRTNEHRVFGRRVKPLCPIHQECIEITCVNIMQSSIVQSGQILFVVKLHILIIPKFIKSSFKAINCISYRPD